MSVMVAEVASNNVVTLPSNGRGGTTIPYAPDKVTNALEVYTATTCTGTFLNDPSVGTSAGNIVTTSDGYYGIFVSATAGSVTVDKWRHRFGGVGTPAGLSNCRVMNGSFILMNVQQTYIHRITLTHTALATFSITDLWGNALYTHTPVGTLATGKTYTLEFCTGQGEPGLYFAQPIGFRCSAGTTVASVVFSA